MTRHSTPLAERFYELVGVRGEADCWQWLGYVKPEGYAYYDGQRAARVAYTISRGSIPAGRELDHTCHTDDSTCIGGVACLHRRCVNPYHLEPITHLDNVRRSAQQRPGVRRALRCLAGHLLLGDNVIGQGARRICRTCRDEAEARAPLFFGQVRNDTQVVTAHLFDGSPAPSSTRVAQVEDPFSARFHQADRGDNPTAPAVPGGCSEPTEPDLPMAFVPCRACGEMVPLHAVECPECGQPHPREVGRTA